MICHKTKSIFIHIPRTAGTSIEVAFQDKDQWNVNPRTKHLIASTAKRLYKDYWNDYFKFSFVRNPWDRMISMCKYGNSHPREANRTYGCDINTGTLNMDNYFKKFPTQREIDPRTLSADDNFGDTIPNSVYFNILNEKIDFIGKFENLHSDIKFISDKLNTNIVLQKKEISRHRHYSFYYDEPTRKLVETTYAYDIKKLNYQFEKLKESYTEHTLD